jgi:hypothetical protein
MFSRNTVFVWVGIIVLSGMFLMGQDSWTPTQEPRIVFVSSTWVNGAIIGVGDADQICQDEATAEGLPGFSYRAWISDTSSSPDTRFDKTGGPYELPLGQKVADDWADLTDGTLDHYINQTADGTGVSTPQKVWTNTNEDGTAANNSGDPNIDHCDYWSLGFADLSGIFGFAGGILWSNAHEVERCNISLPLYCFQQL